MLHSWHEFRPLLSDCCRALPSGSHRKKDEAPSHIIALPFFPLSHKVIPSALYSGWLTRQTTLSVASYLQKITTLGVYATLCLHDSEIDNWISLWVKLCLPNFSKGTCSLATQNASGQDMKVVLYQFKYWFQKPGVMYLSQGVMLNFLPVHTNNFCQTALVSLAQDRFKKPWQY